MTHDDVRALAPEYVLGLLDEVTSARVAAHLSGCAACVAEVRAVAQTFDAVGRSVLDIAPPASLRDRITAIPATVSQPAASRIVVPPAVRSASRVAPWFAAVAAGLVAAIAVWQAGIARAEVSRLRQELALVQLDASQSLVARASLERQVEEFTRQTSVLRSSDLVSYSLVRQPGAPGGPGDTVAHARAYVTHKGGMVFTAEGLPVLSTDKVYQLWVIVDAKPVSVGLFTADASGRVHALMPTPAISAMPGAVAVTIEPAGGMPQPTTSPILIGTAQPQ